MRDNDAADAFAYAIKAGVIERGYDPYNHYGKNVPVVLKSQWFVLQKAVNKSVIEMGDMDVYLQRRWNWFHRAMMRFVFGWKVINL